MLFFLSTTAALHESQLRIILVYLIVGLGAAPLFILCLTQAALVPLTLQTAGRAPLLGPKLCSVNRVLTPLDMLLTAIQHYPLFLLLDTPVVKS